MNNLDKDKKSSAILYIHGKGGSAKEAEHYNSLFPSCDVIGMDYRTFTPWETGKEIEEEVKTLKNKYREVILIANSIGAFFSMNANINDKISHAYFISPIVNMEKLISDMMGWANVTEADLQERGIIHTDFGEELSWDYLCYVKSNPIKWSVPTDILYGSEDHLTDISTIEEFTEKHKASLTIMQGGEHWFHTDEQMKFLDKWIQGKF